MKIPEMILTEDLFETVRYNQKGIPLYIQTAELADYPDMGASCHWHDDIEWVSVLSGKMCFYVNGTRFLLQPGDSLMVNFRQMHHLHSFQQQNCLFSCVLFHPALFCGNPLLQKRYIVPVLENPSLEYLYFPADPKEGYTVCETVKKIVQLKEASPAAWELEAVAAIHSLWGDLLRQKFLFPKETENPVQNELTIQKAMISYIYQHYADKISLNEIAAAGHVSRSKCCRMFARYLQQSPIEFLNSYRLKISGGLLRNTEQNVTEIACSCGFSHLSYFSKVFSESYGCTPTEYRRQSIGPAKK